jgi:hypothetical protein
MSKSEDQPIITTQTTAQNEAVETVLARMDENEVFIPPYQRDSDEWDEVKKSLFIESILNRLTVPAFCFAPSENDPDKFEVVDGQQRLTTLQDFFKGRFDLLDDETCPYFGNSVHYAGCKYETLDDAWKKSFRRYNLTLVTLPQGISLDLRLEIFRRINEGGTPLSAQDIRLSYYSESSAVRFIQLAGIYDPERSGAQRMIGNCASEFDWPWRSCADESKVWRRWWNNTKTVTGQTSSEMFLWYVVGRCRSEIDRILTNKTHLTTNLSLAFRNSTEEVLDIVCAQMKLEDLNRDQPRLLPSAHVLRSEYFAPFLRWWYAMRQKCAAQVNVAKYRSVALLIPGLIDCFGVSAQQELTDNHWGWIGKFIAGTRSTAEELGVDFPESKGRWSGTRGQRKQLDAYFEVAHAIRGK